MREVKIESLKPVFIPFLWTTQHLGRAEFVVCTQYKRGRLCKVWIYPTQQEGILFYWVMEGARDGLYIKSYEGLIEPKVWITGWCKEHKSQFLRLYVPDGAAFLMLEQSADHFNVCFTKTKW